jgi:ComF family protein
VRRPCPRCGLSLPAASCPATSAAWTVATVVAPFRYAEPLQGYLQALKFAGRRNLGRALGELLVDHLVATGMAEGIDSVVAVPLHRRRLISRGYNQAVEIARPIVAALRIPKLVAGIVRCRSTAAQSELSALERRANLRGAFAVNRPLDGRRIAVIDDVMTTGATVNTLALVLLRAGAESVQAWTVARAL